MYKYTARLVLPFENCNPQSRHAFRSSSLFNTLLGTLIGFSFALLHVGQRQVRGWALRLLTPVFIVSLLF